jgi:DNA-directed RNA polymerase subunit RPC12/RpoP
MAEATTELSTSQERVNENPVSYTTEFPDYMAEPYCCMTCSARFTFGKMRIGKVNEMHPQGLSCPHCGDGLGLHPAGGDAVALDAYHGPIPEKLS